MKKFFALLFWAVFFFALYHTQTGSSWSLPVESWASAMTINLPTSSTGTCSGTSQSAIDFGLAYRESHKKALANAEKERGVSQEGIIAILRQETCLGKNLGTEPAINTLYENYRKAKPERKPAMKKKIDALIRVSVLTKRDLQDIPGSSAGPSGAFGIPQFLPENYARFGVDGNGDKIVDLFNHDDAIASSANLLSENGYEESPRAAICRYRCGNPDCEGKDERDYKRYTAEVMAYTKALQAERE